MACAQDHQISKMPNFAFCVGAIALSKGFFSEENLPTLVSDVNCDGTESKLLDCSYVSGGSCGLFEDATVVCQGNIWNLFVPYLKYS